MTTSIKPSLDQAVRQVIDEGRVGRPSFARCVSRVDAASLEDEMTELISLATGWFGGPASDSFPQRDDGGTYRTQMLKWPAGQGALLIVSTVPVLRGPHLDVMLVGSKGTIYFEE